MSEEPRVVSDDGLVELRGAESVEDATIQDIWIAGQPLGKIVHRLRKDMKQVQSDVADLQAGEVDASDVVTVGGENLLPIQSWTLERRGGTEFNSKNKYRATFVWEEFYRQAMDGRKYRKLKSAQVKNILRDPDGLDLTDPNPNTVKRVMQFVAKGTGEGQGGDPRDSDANLVWLETEDGSNVLKAIKSEWYEFVERQQDALAPDDTDTAAGPSDDPVSPENGQGEDVTAEIGTIEAAEAVTADEDDTVQSSVEYEADGGDITLS